MNSSDVFNLVLWGGAAAIFLLAKIRSRDGRVCLETLYFGLTGIALYGAVDCAIRGESGMSALVSLVGICASGEAFALRRKRRKKEAESRSDGDDTIQKRS